MHSIIKLHVGSGNGKSYPVYVFVDKIVYIEGRLDDGSNVVLVDNNDYDKTPLSVDESPEEILNLIAEAEAAEADEDRTLLSDTLDYQKSLYQSSVAAKVK